MMMLRGSERQNGFSTVRSDLCLQFLDFNCQLRSIDSEHRNAELQIRIGERAAWGRGYGTDAVRLLVRHAFDDLDLHRVHLHVFATNDRAVRAYEKAGFQPEGRLRDGALIDGGYVDVLVMATLRS